MKLFVVNKDKCLKIQRIMKRMYVKFKVEDIYVFKLKEFMKF